MNLLWGSHKQCDSCKIISAIFGFVVASLSVLTYSIIKCHTIDTSRHSSSSPMLLNSVTSISSAPRTLQTSSSTKASSPVAGSDHGSQTVTVTWIHDTPMHPSNPVLPRSMQPSSTPSKYPIASTSSPANFDPLQSTEGCCSGNRIRYNLSANLIDDFAYYINRPNVPEVALSPFDLIIVDYSHDGSGEMAFTSAEVNFMKGIGTTEEKILLSYISIGEAEEYRYYWEGLMGDDDDGPPWLALENPEWPGNYKVEYWDEDWQAIVFDMLDKVIEAGFDGIYCDIIDAFEYYKDKGRDSAAEEMVEFVAGLSKYGKEKAKAMGNEKEFLIFVQNGSELLNDPRYLAVIDGIGQEDLFFYESSTQSSDETALVSAHLDVAKNAGKVVLVVEYISTEEDICDFYRECEERFYLCHVSVRELNTLSDNACYPAT